MRTLLRRDLRWLLVVALAILVYAHTISFGLVYDDQEIARSPLVRDPWNVLAVFAGRFYSGQLEHVHLYRPLSQWSLLLTWRANEVLFGAGDHGLLFHAQNVLLHAGASLLLLVWLGRLGLSRFVALVAALLFAVHPIHGEAVGNVSARSEPMALVFGLAFLLLDRRGRTVGAATALLLALWCKESAATFLPLAFVADLLFPPEEGRHSLRRGLLYATVLGGWFALRAHAVQGQEAVIPFFDNPIGKAGVLVRVCTAAAAQVAYLGTLLWPVGIATDHGYADTRPVASPFEPSVLAFAAILAVAAAASWRLLRRAPVVALAVLGYAVVFSATSNFLFPIGTIRAERLAYAPSAFFCLLVAAGLEPLADRFPRATLRLVVPAIVLALGGLATAHVRAWRDAGTFFRHQARTAPASAKSHLNLARQLDAEGDLSGAVREYERSGAIYANYKLTWLFLGNARRRLGDVQGAVEAWRFALRVDASFLDARARIVDGLLDTGRRDEALAEWRVLLQANLFHPRTLVIATRLWEGSSVAEREVALADIERARARLGEDPAAALDLLSRAEASGALPGELLPEVFARIADGHERLGRPGRAEAFRQAARVLREDGRSNRTTTGPE